MKQVGYLEQVRYPAQFSVDYPDRPLNRLSTAFRIVLVIPIAIVLSAGPPFRAVGSTLVGALPASWTPRFRLAAFCPPRAGGHSRSYHQPARQPGTSKECERDVHQHQQQRS
jgi:hypothetical protein